MSNSSQTFLESFCLGVSQMLIHRTQRLSSESILIAYLVFSTTAAVFPSLLYPFPMSKKQFFIFEGGKEVFKERGKVNKNELLIRENSKMRKTEGFLLYIAVVFFILKLGVGALYCLIAVPGKGLVMTINHLLYIIRSWGRPNSEKRKQPYKVFFFILCGGPFGWVEISRKDSSGCVE